MSKEEVANPRLRRSVLAACFTLQILFLWPISHAATFRLATYNVENYILEPRGSRPAKSKESCRVICSNLVQIDADVIALQEIGGRQALFFLRTELGKMGLAYPHADLITAFDTNIQIAVLSRFPIVERALHTNDSYLLMGRHLQVGRGFLEIDIQPTPAYRFTLITAHLKSRRPVPFADEAEMRFKEAEVLRKKIDARLDRQPDANIVVLGDMNDLQNSRTLRMIRGRGKRALVDLRPVERHPSGSESSDKQIRSIAWTHYYAVEDVYSRIDYIMASQGMAREWHEEGTYVPLLSGWGAGSDHRPIVAEFLASDR